MIPPVTLEGYYQMPTPDGVTAGPSIYKCIPPNACLGGGPNSCVKHSWGSSCSRCENNYFRKGVGSSYHGCSKCMTNSHIYLPLIYIVVLLIGTAVVYLVTSTGVSAGTVALMRVAACATILVDSLFSFNILSSYKVNWPPSLFTVASSSVDLFVIRPECLNLEDSLENFTWLNLLVPTLYCCFTFFWYAFTRLTHKWRTNNVKHPDSVNNKVIRFMLRCIRAGPMKVDKCLNACGVITMAFYLGILRMALGYFVCYKQPNGSLTLLEHPYIQCFGSEWLRALPLAIAGVLLYVVTLNIVVIYCVANGPELTRNIKWATRLRFLFVRFKPEAYYWSLVLQLRSVLLSLLPVVLYSYPLLQTCCGLLVLLLMLTCTATIRPWAHHASDALDISLQTCVLVFFLVVTFYSLTVDMASLNLFGNYGDRSDYLNLLIGSLSIIASIVFYLALTIGGVFILAALYAYHRRNDIQNKKYTSAKRIVRSFDRCLLSYSSDEIRVFLLSLRECDRLNVCITFSTLVSDLSLMSNINTCGTTKYRNKFLTVRKVGRKKISINNTIQENNNNNNNNDNNTLFEYDSDANMCMCEGVCVCVSIHNNTNYKVMLPIKDDVCDDDDEGGGGDDDGVVCLTTNITDTNHHINKKKMT
eukprot:GHVR01094957.1.p1 GENE.GHVR01094957.1~~GHVR01094957.1.p1  ORF type:complete len:643 (-),score=134.34 GHVR01094957.1:220-2148(-)